jgi:hypothetical protein
MANDFDWQNEEDGDWRQQPATPAGVTARRTWHRRPLLLLAFVLLASGALAYFGLARQTAAREAAVVQDVLRSHALVAEAGRRADEELYRLLLSSRDPAWVEGQMALLAAGLLFERAPLGLNLAAAEGNVVAVTLSADLQEAVVSSDWFYTFDGRDGPATTILRQAAVYRHGAAGWLLEPPLPDFWGPTLSESGRYVRFTFPERDQLLARRLAADLDETIGHACHKVDQLLCRDLLLEIDLSATPSALAALAVPEAFLPAGLHLVLPAPTLAGLPLDETGYQALYHGYAARAVAAVINHELGWNCCQRALFYQALLDKQLVELGLRSWPLTAADYRQVLRQSASLADVSRLWYSTAATNLTQAQPEGWLAYALVDYVLEHSLVETPAEMHHRFLSSPNFDRWLRTVTPVGSLALATTSESSWSRFLLGRALLSQTAPPIAWPEEDLLLMCGDEWGHVTPLRLYNAASGAWTELLEEPAFILMTPLPGNAGILFVEMELGPEEQAVDVPARWRTLLWQNGRQLEISSQPIFQFFAIAPDPAEQYLPLLTYDVDYDTYGVTLLDLDSCRAGDCRLLPIDGIPAWSPGGSQAILSPTSFVPDEPGALRRSGRLGEAPVALPGSGQPFWLDETTYGYLSDGAGGAVMIADSSDDVPMLLLEAADLVALLPADVDPERLRIRHLVVGGDASLYLLVHHAEPGSAAAQRRPRTQASVLVYDWPAGRLSLLAQWEDQGLAADYMSPLSFSPDGRWLVASQLRELATGVSAVELYFIDLWQQRHELIRSSLGQHWPADPVTRWSADGRWFVRLVEGGLVLTAPGYEYDYLVLHEFGPCRGIAWTGKGE